MASRSSPWRVVLWRVEVPGFPLLPSLGVGGFGFPLLVGLRTGAHPLGGSAFLGSVGLSPLSFVLGVACLFDLEWQGTSPSARRVNRLGRARPAGLF